MDDVTSTAGLIAIGAAVVALVALAVAVRATLALRRVRLAQQRVLGEHGDTDLITHAAGLQEAFADLNAYVEQVAARIDGRLETAEGRLDASLTHHGLVRYDAYNEMSGRQSTTIALLDSTNSGIVLSSIHHRDQARMYAKQVTSGRGELELSPEEEEAVRVATSAPGLTAGS